VVRIEKVHREQVIVGDRGRIVLPASRAAELSLGERAYLALASRVGASVLTANRAWSALPLEVKLQAIG